MENFTNEIIDTSQLPRFEEVPFTSLHASYWKVTLVNLILFILIIGTGLGFAFYHIAELAEFQVYIILAFGLLMMSIVAISCIAFRKKGYAFRNHDVLFRDGIIATNTIIIPYNRVQHVALHEGLVSRYFGLASIAIFTAGESASDLHIPGIKKEEAENIKQLLMGKIQKQL
jgi:membrane protein YdbS with pleckstrin-like domain